MSKDKNENLGLDNILGKVQKQSQELNLNKKEESTASIKQNKKSKKVVIQVRFDSDELEILKEHLNKKGYDTYSTGIRGIIKKYMIDNNLINV